VITCLGKILLKLLLSLGKGSSIKLVHLLLLLVGDFVHAVFEGNQVLNNPVRESL